MEKNPNFKAQMSNQVQNPNSTKKYDLKERTAKFGEDIIKFAMTLPRHAINNPLINQLVRATTSIGANYMEADGAESKKDFYHKIATCKKESKESMHWIHMISISNSTTKEKCRKFWKEAHELALIFSSILRK